MTLSARTLSGWHKLRWGLRVVGPAATLRGAASLGALAVRRPERGRVHLASGGELEFAYPSQFPPALVLFGDLIDPEYEFLRRVLQPDGVVVDVGAAIGQFSVFAALQGARVVHAFEPSDANLEMLSVNLNLNRVEKQVCLHRVALADSPGEASFTTAARTYMSRLDQRGGGSRDQSATVPVRRLDDQMAELGVSRVHVLKVNVAGYEPIVLDGAGALLTEGRVDILILLVGVSSMLWYERLHDLGYALGYFHPETHTFHRVDRVDSRLLSVRPWPARHLLAVRPSLLEGAAASVHLARLGVQ